MKLILVRHGQSEANRQRIIAGQTDSPLTTQGLEEARRAADRVQRLGPILALYSSPLQRALQTARPIAKYSGLEPRLRHDLMEINGGTIDGMTGTELREKYPDLLARWRASDRELMFPGGESLGDFFQRAWNGLEEIRNQHHAEAARGNVVVVTHGGVIGAYISRLMRGTPNNLWSTRFTNCSVTHVDLGCDPAHVLCYVNPASDETVTFEDWEPQPLF